MKLTDEQLTHLNKGLQELEAICADFKRCDDCPLNNNHGCMIDDLADLFQENMRHKG